MKLGAEISAILTLSSSASWVKRDYYP